MCFNVAYAKSTIRLAKGKSAHVAGKFAGLLQPLPLRKLADFGISLVEPMQTILLAPLGKTGFLILGDWRDSNWFVIALPNNGQPACCEKIVSLGAASKVVELMPPTSL
jgi:hypothetical protein